jgi:hypothetical protein
MVDQRKPFCRAERVTKKCLTERTERFPLKGNSVNLSVRHSKNKCWGFFGDSPAQDTLLFAAEIGELKDILKAELGCYIPL